MSPQLGVSSACLCSMFERSSDVAAPHMAFFHASQYDKAAKDEERKLKHVAGWEKQAAKQAEDKTAGEPLS
jgi:hypothetical protein